MDIEQCAKVYQALQEREEQQLIQWLEHEEEMEALDHNRMHILAQFRLAMEHSHTQVFLVRLQEHPVYVTSYTALQQYILRAPPSDFGQWKPVTWDEIPEAMWEAWVMNPQMNVWSP